MTVQKQETEYRRKEIKETKNKKLRYSKQIKIHMSHKYMALAQVCIDFYVDKSSDGPVVNS